MNSTKQERLKLYLNLIKQVSQTPVDRSMVYIDNEKKI